MFAALKLPPYAKRLRRGDSAVWVFAGPQAWDWAERDNRNKLVLPPGYDPASYRWPVNGRDCIILDTGCADTALQKLAWALLNYGAVRVGCIPREADRYVIFSRKGVRSAA